MEDDLTQFITVCPVCCRVHSTLSVADGCEFCGSEMTQMRIIECHTSNVRGDEDGNLDTKNRRSDKIFRTFEMKAVSIDPIAVRNNKCGWRCTED